MSTTNSQVKKEHAEQKHMRERVIDEQQTTKLTKQKLTNKNNKVEIQIDEQKQSMETIN